MTSEFSRNGVTEKIVSTVTPMVLSKLFKVTVDSLMLLDDKGGYFVPEGNAFEPSLTAGVAYQVKGNDAGTAAIAESQQVVKKSTEALAIISKEELDDIVDSVRNTTSQMNENINMLYDGPNAVTMVNALAVLAAATDDPSLITPKMPREAYVRLTAPGSFRASLYQVAANMFAAFCKADYLMGTIKSSFTDMPDYIQDALQGIAKDNDKKSLKQVVTKMGNASTKCKTAAKEAQKAFDNILKDLHELEIQQCLGLEEQKQQRSKVELQKAKMSMVETAIKDAAEIRNAASDRLMKETERKDKNAEAMRESQRELADLMAKMKNLDLTKVEMDGVIKCLEEGLSYLGKVEQHWTKLAMFFDTINLIVANNLKNSIDNFIEQANDDVRVGRLIEPALVASGLCVQVCNAASIYTDVSHQFVMPVISGIAQNLALSKEAAIAKKNRLLLENHETNEKVRALIDYKMAEYGDKFEGQMLKQQKRLQLLLKD